MKRILYLLIIGIIAGKTSLSQEYINVIFVVNIKLETDSLFIGVANLSYKGKEGSKYESQTIKGNSLKFSGLIDEFTVGTLSIKEAPITTLELKKKDNLMPYARSRFRQTKIPVFLTPGEQTIFISKDFKQVSIEPETKSQKDLRSILSQSLNDYEVLVKKNIYSTETKQATKLSAKKNFLADISAVRNREAKLYEDFIKNNKGEPETMYAFSKIATSLIVSNGLLADTLFHLLPEAFQNSEKGKTVLDKITNANIFSIGKFAKNFEQPNPQNKRIALSDFKGKYVLVDFWASWCKPCREENPNILAAYKTFKDKNFDVLGVSLDSDKSKWIEGIKKDGMVWTQVSDLKGWKNEAAVLYVIQSIPQNLLIDPDGKIIGKNLRGTKLIEALNLIYAKK